MEQEVILEACQPKLPFEIPAQRPPSFSSILSNHALGSRLDELEARFDFVDETAQYRKLVNTSLSKSQPYHRWFRYREGYAGALVKSLINASHINPQKHFVADPMCGSGTTLVASCERGFASLGLDVSPFAVEVSNLKVSRYTKADIDAVLGWASKLSVFAVARSTTSQADESFAKYFDKDNLSSLLHLNSSIRKIHPAGARKLARAAWLGILEECSNRRKDGNGLLTRPSPIKDIIPFFKSQLAMIVKDVAACPLPNTAHSQAVDQTALEFSLAARQFAASSKRKCGAIIFSPPYANSFDYFESYKIELLLGGYFTFKELQEARKRLIRNYRIGYKCESKSSNELVEMLCSEVSAAIPHKEKKTGIRDGRTRLVPNMLRGYFEDMERAIREFRKALVLHGRVHIVVDQSAYVGVPIPTDILLAEIAERNGFRVHRIVKCRPANTSGQQLREFPYLKKLLRESIVDLERQ